MTNRPSRQIVLPTRIREDATLGIFSPSEPLTSSRQERMKESLELLHRNFSTKFAPNAYSHDAYMAGGVEERLEDIETLLFDDAVDALVASWGGKSCNQLVDRLPFEDIREAKKPIVGFSDVCVLLNAITAKTGLVTFYGPNIAGKMHESDHWDLRSLKGVSVPPFGNTVADRWTTLHGGTTSGRLFGGNLSTFVLGLTGTDYMKRMDGAIFFIESASDPPQIVDQYLRCLGNSGFLGRCAGLLVGDVSFDEQPAYKKRSTDDLLGSYAEEFDLVCARIETFGHGRLENPAIPIGASVRLSTDESSVELLAPVVSG